MQWLHLSRLKNVAHDFGMQASMDEQAQVVGALADGDTERCRALLAAHVTASHGRLREQLPNYSR